jgi:arylformamidase
VSALLDISIGYAEGAPVWPGDTPFSCGWTARREDGSSVNLASLHTSAHAGTHADAPLHVESAWSASESLPVDAFMGPAVVVALPELHAAGAIIDVSLLESLLAPHLQGDGRCTRLLVRTGRSVAHGAFPDAWPTLDERGARWIVERGIELFGVDAPSVDARESTTLPVHHALFAGGAYVLENLALDAVAPGHYELFAQPLLVVGADAAPVRALLRARRNEAPRSDARPRD